jgi:hypothetical protein
MEEWQRTRKRSKIKGRSRVSDKANQARQINIERVGDKTFVQICCGGQAGSVAVKFIVMTSGQWSRNEDLTPHYLPGDLGTWSPDSTPQKTNHQYRLHDHLCARGDPLGKHLLAAQPPTFNDITAIQSHKKY